MKLKPYPKYKDSGIKWIGEIPEGWEIVRLKNISLIIMGQSPDSSLVNGEKKGIPFFQGKAEFGNINPKPKSWILQPTRTADKNDILFTVRAPVGALNIANEKCCIGRGLAAIRFNNFKYLYYILHLIEKPLNIISSGSTFEAISVDQLKSITIPYTKDESDQTAIANFLDKKTAKIDALIEKDKKLIALLKEKRTALINHAVTKGLDPNVKLRDSGIEWIGEIPEGWEVRKLKHVSLIIMGQSPDSSLVNGEQEGIPFFQGKAEFGNIYPKPKSWILQPTRTANKNDVLFTVRAPVGALNIANEKCCIGRGLAAIRFNNSKYLYYVLHLTEKPLNIISSGSTFEAISVDQLKSITIPYTKDESDQTAIANYLDKSTSKIDKTIKLIEKKIKLLEEYKKSLIHHVVTGKVDVRSFEQDIYK